MLLKETKGAVIIENIGKLIDCFLKFISSSLKLFPWVADKYSVWKEGGGPGVTTPDEDIPNDAFLSQKLIECAGAYWRPYKKDKGEVFLPQFDPCRSEIGPFCLKCKKPVKRENKTLLRPYFKWRCSENHIHKIPKYFENDLLSTVKDEIQSEIKNLAKK
jgi:hypothetical protein